MDKPKHSAIKEIQDRIERHRRGLEEDIADGVVVSYLADVDHLIELVYVLRGITSIPAIRLKYMGDGKNESDARPDILAIMDACNVNCFTKRIEGYANEYPHLEYRGVGVIGGERMTVSLDVTYLPKSCKVDVTRRRTWSTRASYRTSCTVRR